MEVLTDSEIQAWLDVGYGYGDGYGNGNGIGNGSGSGSGIGEGYGSGSGNGYGNDIGNGIGNGYGYGNDIGNGSGYGIEEYDGNKMYLVDDVPTAILSIHGNVAKGFILERNMYRKDCYIVRENGKFAHGDTLRDAFTSLQEKLYDDSTEEERIEAFVEKFPNYDDKYPNEELFAYHHVLTGSCRMGRESFCKNHNINMAGKTSIREFVELTENDYGGDIIKKLPKEYNQ